MQDWNWGSNCSLPGEVAKSEWQLGTPGSAEHSVPQAVCAWEAGAMWGVLARAVAAGGLLWASWVVCGQGSLAAAGPGETARDGGQSEELQQSAAGGLVVCTTASPCPPALTGPGSSCCDEGTSLFRVELLLLGMQQAAAGAQRGPPWGNAHGPRAGAEQEQRAAR